MPEVSAIVSAYYAEEFIECRLENLLQQDPQPEVIVIAREGSEEAKAAEKTDVMLITTVGVPTLYDAWNMGILRANGKYITNANSDDILYPGALKVMTEALEENPDFALCYADSDVVHQYGGDPTNRMEWIQGGKEEIKRGCFIGSMPLWRASLHLKFGLFDSEMKSAGDYEFWLRIMTQDEKALHIPQALGAYLARPESIYHSKPLLSIWEVARARSRYIKE